MQRGIVERWSLLGYNHLPSELASRGFHRITDPDQGAPGGGGGWGAGCGGQGAVASACPLPTPPAITTQTPCRATSTATMASACGTRSMPTCVRWWTRCTAATQRSRVRGVTPRLRCALLGATNPKLPPVAATCRGPGPPCAVRRDAFQGPRRHQVYVGVHLELLGAQPRSPPHAAFPRALDSKSVLVETLAALVFMCTGADPFASQALVMRLLTRQRPRTHAQRSTRRSTLGSTTTTPLSPIDP